MNLKVTDKSNILYNLVVCIGVLSPLLLLGIGNPSESVVPPPNPGTWKFCYPV